MTTPTVTNQPRPVRHLVGCVVLAALALAAHAAGAVSAATLPAAVAGVVTAGSGLGAALCFVLFAFSLDEDTVTPRNGR